MRMTYREKKNWTIVIGIVMMVVGYFAFMGWICSRPVPEVDGYIPPFAVHTSTRH